MSLSSVACAGGRESRQLRLCDPGSQLDLDAGRFVAIVGVAVIRPAAFVILRITGQTRERD